MSELPDVLREMEAYVYDFNTGELLAQGLANVTFTRERDPLRVKRNLFEGEFYPGTEEEIEGLKRRLIAGLSVGAPAMSMQIDYEGETYVFTIKFELGELCFPFTGRAEPTKL